MPEPIQVGVGPGEVPVLVTPEMRSTHLHIIGATGQGKSKLLEHLITQDIGHRHGLCLIDPHGALYREIVAWCAHQGLHRNDRRRIHLINPSDEAWTVGFNPLRCQDPEHLSTVVESAVSACAQVWGGANMNETPRLEKCLRAVFYALAASGLTLADGLRLTRVRDVDGFRAQVTGPIDDEAFRPIWDDLNSLTERQFAETFESTQNRLTKFLANPSVRRMLRLTEAAVDVRRCMEEGDILLVNLQPSPTFSAESGRVIGTLLTNSLFHAARGRDEKRAARRPFYLYIDECYNFLTTDVEGMLDQTRKAGLHVTLAHQRLGQLHEAGEQIFSAVMASARTKVVFGLDKNEDDAEYLARVLLRDTFDYNRPKTILSKPTVVGYERIELRGRGRAQGRARTEGTSSGSASSAGTVSGMGMSQAFDVNGQPLTQIYTGSETAGESSGSSWSESSMTADTQSEVLSETVGEALMPILEVLPSAVEGHEEIMNRAILAIRKLPQRAFLLALPGQSSQLLVTPTLEEVPVSPRRIEGFMEGARQKSRYTLPRHQAEALSVQPATGQAMTEDLDEDPFSVPEGGRL